MLGHHRDDLLMPLAEGHRLRSPNAYPARTCHMLAGEGLECRSSLTRKAQPRTMHSTARLHKGQTGRAGCVKRSLVAIDSPGIS